METLHPPRPPTDADPSPTPTTTPAGGVSTPGGGGALTRVSDLRFQQRNKDWQRVIVVGDVLALPFEGWSMGGFGCAIDVDWLLRQGKLPGSKEMRTELAGILVRALDYHHFGGKS